MKNILLTFISMLIISIAESKTRYPQLPVIVDYDAIRFEDPTNSDFDYDSIDARNNFKTDGFGHELKGYLKEDLKGYPEENDNSGRVYFPKDYEVTSDTVRWVIS